MDEAWLSTVRLARDIGDISSLFPPGITRLTDLPFTIHNAIASALSFLSFEELIESEQPPKTIWLNAKKMKQWWEEVKRLRKEAQENPDGDQSHMAKNALTDQLLIGF